MEHHQNSGNLLRQGVNVFIILAVLTALEFAVAVTSASMLLLVTMAIIKAGLVLWNYMHVSKLGGEDEGHEDDRESYAFKTETNRLGLWLFLLSDAFLFAGLLVTRFNLMGLTRLPLNQTLGLVVTSVLLISSFFMNRAEVQMSQGNKKGFTTNIVITIALGVVFLLGVLGVEWRLAAAEGVIASANAASAAFYMMTGMHAFHVLTGVIFLLIVLRNTGKGLYNEEKHWPVEAATVYWHFIDLVWIFFYPALYLIGRLM
ncbi:heme-copper oxidase subunit III [bacterium]|nr:heme-copper oxidase subunit III [bacterium]NCT20107.1 heme-copper oxidase subunit III [bacterium]